MPWNVTIHVKISKSQRFLSFASDDFVTFSLFGFEQRLLSEERNVCNLLSQLIFPTENESFFVQNEALIKNDVNFVNI